MKSVFELKPILVAGVIGAVALILVDTYLSQAPAPGQQTPPMTSVAGYGFLVGAVVQIGVRITGVS
jgi:hypothetical protein